VSVFSKLCLRARELGAGRLIFTADIFATETSPGICGDWTCVGGSKATEDSIGIAHGRTGEEALRNLVDQLEAK
jgi:hypothetical protein